MRREYEDAKRYRAHPEEFYAFMLQSIVLMVNGTIALLLLVGAILLTPSLEPPDFIWCRPTYPA